jgi:hypothetical protein
MRQGSTSEKESDAGGMLRPLPRDLEGKGVHEAVVEETGEVENGSGMRPRDEFGDENDTH